MSKVFSLGTVSSILIVIYLAFTVQKLYELMNPLSGVEIVGPTIDPLWTENQHFSMISFLSTSTRFKKVDIKSLRSQDKIVFERHGLIHNLQDQDMHVDLILLDKRYPTPSLERGTFLKNNATRQEVFASPELWGQIHANQTEVYLHVVLVRTSPHKALQNVISSRDMLNGDALTGYVCLIKHDRVPHRFRYRYLLSDFGLVNMSAVDVASAALPASTVISFWKPEVAVKIVSDFSRYPLDHVPEVMSRFVVHSSSGSGKHVDQSPPRYRPPVHVDEIGLTTDKYIPLNSSVHSLGLSLSFGPMSLQRWLLMSTMEHSLKAQGGVGFTDKDMDDVRRLISDTSVYLLAVTFLASMLHLLFEVLAFQSDVSFWQSNTSLAGLSTRAVVTDLISQLIVFLFLVQSDASLLITVPSFAGILVQTWKMNKATGPALVWRGWLPWVEFTRWKAIPYSDVTSQGGAISSGVIVEGEKRGIFTDSVVTVDQSIAVSSIDAVTEDVSVASITDTVAAAATTTAAVIQVEVEVEDSNARLCRVTLEADRFATVYLSALLSPLVVAFALRSLVYERHLSWYSWVIGALTSCVYAFGFVLMCPQLYINHSLKSVSHLPWNFLVYKFLNTFIDDLFAFVIKMPTMHRLSVFRDDLVFFIYLYQRWHYRVDETRPVEK